MRGTGSICKGTRRTPMHLVLTWWCFSTYRNLAARGVFRSVCVLEDTSTMECTTAYGAHDGEQEHCGQRSYLLPSNEWLLGPVRSEPPLQMQG